MTVLAGMSIFYWLMLTDWLWIHQIQTSPVHTLNAYALIGIGRLTLWKLNA